MNAALLARLPEIQTKIAELAGLENVEAILDRLAVDLAGADPFEVELSLPLRIEVLCRQYLRLKQLHDEYDGVVWDAIWKTLKDDSGQIFLEHRDKRFIAQDLNHDAWVRIAEQIGEFKERNTNGKSSIPAWLWKVTQNVVIDFKRKGARRAGLGLAPPGSATEASNLTAGLDGQAGTVLPRPNPWYRGKLRADRLVRRNRRAVLCQECGGVIPVISGTFRLACGHARPKGFK